MPMRFIKWLLVNLWTPLNIRFSVVYGFVAQLKFLLEIMLILGGLYFLWFGVKPSNKMLAIGFVVVFGLAAWIGDILIKHDIPQRIAEKNNKINPQLDKINEILEILKKE